jgi:hypothetical protein
MNYFTKAFFIGFFATAVIMAVVRVIEMALK